MANWCKHSYCICVLIILMTSCHAKRRHSDNSTRIEESARRQQHRWADSAFSLMKSFNCSKVLFTTRARCEYLQSLNKTNVVVYAAVSERGGGKLRAVLPDGGLERLGSHDGVIVLDPFSHANFGHLVLVFFVDVRTSRSRCTSTESHVYTDHGECISIALKQRCRNAIAKLQSRSNRSRRTERKLARRCEINFLPLVYKSSSRQGRERPGDTVKPLSQLLLCIEPLFNETYAECPEQRTFNGTVQLSCNPVRDNTRRCETTYDLIDTSCRMFESCDKAVILSGGWNRQTSLVRDKESVKGFYSTLRRNGFETDSIKVFYANGIEEGDTETFPADSKVFPAASKLAMRFHIRRLCETPHCVNSLVIYSNSPTKHDGTMLLWDVNSNGKAEDSEQYTVEELLEDTASCQAKQTIIIADQSYAGEITRGVRRSDNHSNILALASSKDNEYSYNGWFTRQWVMANHSHTCAREVFQQIKASMEHSNPDMTSKQTATGPMTLFGAPCAVKPPFSEAELDMYYRGCQNIPTEVWLRTFFSPQ